MTKGTMAGLAAALALGGCTTTFYGNPKVQNGPRGCWDQCEAWGMDLAGMVKMGEYSDGCICQVRLAPQQPQPTAPSSDARTYKLDGPAVAGVWIQMQAAAANAAQASSFQLQQQQRQPWMYGGAGHHH